MDFSNFWNFPNLSRFVVVAGKGGLKLLRCTFVVRLYLFFGGYDTVLRVIKFSVFRGHVSSFFLSLMGVNVDRWLDIAFHISH